jgi:hypothetical protein
MSDITPVAWALYNSRNPEFNEVEFAYPCREPITEGDMKAGWTATPLFTREQAAAEERAKIVAWLHEAGYRQIADAIEAKEHLK